MTWSEQTEIEAHAPEYLKDVIRIITETGLRVYKELASMRKEQIDLSNKVVFVADFQDSHRDRGGSIDGHRGGGFSESDRTGRPWPMAFSQRWLPARAPEGLQEGLGHNAQESGVRYFRLYALRSTYATRLSAGGLADEWVTQMLRQTDAQVFKRYSHMKIQMKRGGLRKLNRKASEVTAVVRTSRFDTVLARK
jgi:integrase